MAASAICKMGFNGKFGDWYWQLSEGKVSKSDKYVTISKIYKHGVYSLAPGSKVWFSGQGAIIHSILLLSDTSLMLRVSWMSNKQLPAPTELVDINKIG